MSLPIKTHTSSFISKGLPMFLTIEKKQVSVARFSIIFDHKLVYISKAWIACHIQVHAFYLDSRVDVASAV